MIDTKMFQHLNGHTRYLHGNFSGKFIDTQKWNLIYSVSGLWCAENGFTLLNVAYINHEVFVTYETNKELGED